MSEPDVFGQAEISDSSNSYNQQAFLITSMLNKINSVMLVKVINVTNSKIDDKPRQPKPMGFVDVQIMVNQMTGNRQSVPHGTIYNVPYFRLQGGSDAVIIDPAPGDIGMCGFCSRDISSFKFNRAKDLSDGKPERTTPANPGSYRKYDYSDGLYFGGMLNATPVQWIAFSADSIHIHTPHNIILTAGENITMTAGKTISTDSGDSTTMKVGKGMTVDVSDNLDIKASKMNVNADSAFTGTLTSNGKDISSTHVHSNSGGTGNGGPPI